MEKREKEERDRRLNNGRRKWAVAVMTVMIAALAIAFAGNDVNVTDQAYAADATKTAKAADKKAKKVTLNIIVMSEEDAQVDLTITRLGKTKKVILDKTLELKKGMNYLAYPKTTKGKYQVGLNAYGDDVYNQVTALSGMYTVFFNIAPPKDGDGDKKKNINYQILK